MTRRIVVPMDFSPHADAALQYATELAKAVGGSICLVHVVENPVEGGAWSGQPYAVPAEAEPIRRADEAEHLLNARLAALPAEFATGSWVRTGEVGAAIVAFARGMHADLIAMGTNGRTGLSRLVTGSVAEYVVRHAPCAVLTIRAETVGTTARAEQSVQRPRTSAVMERAIPRAGNRRHS
jgi:nucleotide-binding universal stress UspA family protein